MFKTQLSQTAMEELKLAIDNLFSLVISVNYTRDTYIVLKSDYFNLVESEYRPDFKKLATEYLARYSAEDFKNCPLIFNFDALVEHLKNNNGAYSMEVKLQLTPSNYHWFEVKYLLVENAENDDINLLILVQDINNRKMIEENLKEAFKATEIAAKAKTDFLSKMSQDLKTPINMIISTIDMARENISNQEAIMDSLIKMDISARYLFKIIDNAIDLAQIESGRFNIDHRSFNIADMIEDMYKAFDPTAAAKNVIFDVMIHNNGLDRVMGDAYRVNQIVKNLVSNSFKYVPAGGTVSLELLLTKIVSNRAHFSIIVENDGPSLKEEEIERLFRPFEQGDISAASMYEPFKGMGLGLSLCKNIVELLGGSIHASNKPEKTGVRFEVHLSFLMDETCLPTDLEYISDDAYLRFPDKHILMADDDEESYEAIKSLLQPMGIKVDLAINGLEAVASFEESSPGYYDLIFMNTNLPLMSGFDAAETIRNSFREDGASVPIVALLYAQQNDAMKALEKGMNAHIVKPIDVNKVFYILNTFLK